MLKSRLNWISVKDRLPETNVLVLAFCYDCEIAELVQTIDPDGKFVLEWVSTFNDSETFPSHWMPLPDPPEFNV